MFDRYGADEIILVLVTPGAALSDAPTEVILRRLTRTAERKEAMRVSPADANERIEVRVATAANAAAGAIVQIASATAEDEQFLEKAADKLPVTFEYANPREFARMQQAVRETPGVLALRLPAIRLQSMQATVYLTTARPAVRTALVKQGILVAEKNGGWVLSYR